MFFIWFRNLVSRLWRCNLLVFLQIGPTWSFKAKGMLAYYWFVVKSGFEYHVGHPLYVQAKGNKFSLTYVASYTIFFKPIIRDILVNFIIYTARMRFLISNENISPESYASCLHIKAISDEPGVFSLRYSAKYNMCLKMMVRNVSDNFSGVNM